MAVAAAALDGRPALDDGRPRDLWRFALRFTMATAGMVAAGLLLPAPLAVLAVGLVLLPWLWQAPVRAVYLLVAAAILIEIFPLGYPDSLTDRVPLFQNLSNVGLPGVAMSPVEVLMLEAVAVGLLKGQLQLPRGRLLGPYLAFMAVVAFSELHGLLSGGDFKLSLWELRPQAYGFVLFSFAGSLIRNRQQLVTLASITLVATCAKAVLGDIRWQFTLGHDPGTHETLLGHEDSYFLALFLLALLVALLAWRQRRFLVPVLVASPLVGLCLLANQRRAGFFALGGALAVATLLAIRFFPAARRQALALAFIGLVGAGTFIAFSWNEQYGIRGQLVRPVRSLIDPSARDSSSDLYRKAENANLLFSFRQNPILGMGFGMPFLTPYPQADISAIYPLWNVIPHNTLMWVPMRAGVLGMVGFWGLVAAALLEVCWVLRTRHDPMLRAIAVFAAGAIVAELLLADVDLQLESYRNLIYFGALLGVVNNLGGMPDA